MNAMTIAERVSGMRRVDPASPRDTSVSEPDVQAFRRFTSVSVDANPLLIPAGTRNIELIASRLWEVTEQLDTVWKSYEEVAQQSFLLGEMFIKATSDLRNPEEQSADWKWTREKLADLVSKHLDMADGDTGAWGRLTSRLMANAYTMKVGPLKRALSDKYAEYGTAAYNSVYGGYSADFLAEYGEAAREITYHRENLRYAMNPPISDPPCGPSSYMKKYANCSNDAKASELVKNIEAGFAGKHWQRIVANLTIEQLQFRLQYGTGAPGEVTVNGTNRAIDAAEANATLWSNAELMDEVIQQAAFTERFARLFIQGGLLDFEARLDCLASRYASLAHTYYTLRNALESALTSLNQRDASAVEFDAFPESKGLLGAYCHNARLLECDRLRRVVDNFNLSTDYMQESYVFDLKLEGDLLVGRHSVTEDDRCRWISSVSACLIPSDYCGLLLGLRLARSATPDVALELGAAMPAPTFTSRNLLNTPLLYSDGGGEWVVTATSPELCHSARVLVTFVFRTMEIREQ